MALAVGFSGYAPTVMAPASLHLGKFPLQAGVRKVSILIRGNHPQSSAFFVGTARWRRTRVGDH